jgi:hypothetical protein
MSQAYTRTIKAIGDMDIIFDRMCANIRAKGFKIISSEKPNLIIAERGMIRPTAKVHKFPHTIVIAFHVGESEPLISFSYIMSDLWDYTSGDQDFFNEEINSVIASLNMNTSFIDLRATRETVAINARSYYS